MIPNLVYLHSILRYFILLFAIIVVVQSVIGYLGNGKFKKINKQAALALLIFCDLQLVLGLLLYYFRVVSGGMLSGGNVMKDTYTRFYAVEHSVGMIAAIVLVHVGFTVTKRNMDDDRRFKKLFWCTFLALILFMMMIPWQSRPTVGRPNIPAMPRS